MRVIADERADTILVRFGEARPEDYDDPGAAPGGLSIYRRNAAHGPFVHMDARGYRARW